MMFALALAILFATPAPPAQAPDVTGEWTGTWSCTTRRSRRSRRRKATVQGTLTALRPPYKYTITMEGRAAGKTVLFKGTADLGPKDGGVYHWIGRATEKEFVGFYTNAYYTGVFTLTRTK